MNATSTVDSPENASHIDHDDLTVLTGIANQRQKKLLEMGYSTLHDIADLEGNRAEMTSVAEELGVALSVIEQAVGEAKERVGNPGPAHNPVVEPDPPGNDRGTDPPNSPGEWQTHAVFWVEFQSLEDQAGQEEQQILIKYIKVQDGVWAEEELKDRKGHVIEGEQIYPWMLEQLGETARPEPGPEPEYAPETRAVSAPYVTVKINQVQAFQDPHAETPVGTAQGGHMLSGIIRSDEAFMLAASFGLEGESAEEATRDSVFYQAQFSAYDLATGALTHLGDTRRTELVEGQLLYTARLPSIALPPGLYRLRIAVALEGTRAIPGYLEVPLLQVV